MRALLSWVVAGAVGTVGLAAGCSGSPRTAGAPPKASMVAVDSALVPVAAPSGSAEVEPAPQAVRVVAGEPQDPECPTGMELVDGDYCSDVKQTCTKQWNASQNKIHVCEEFEVGTKCVGKTSHKRYCMDRYEFPNKKGERPEVMNRFHQAEIKCAAQGKRMCTESEWNLACEGPEMKPFPYGWTRDPLVCNGDNLWDGPNMKKVEARDPTELARLWRGVRSGSSEQCKSDYGIFDLPGNADEVCANEHAKGKTTTGKFDSVNTGGPWYSGVRNQCRPKVYTHGEDFYYYYLSFRCCAEADGAATNPLTPRQQKDGWDISKVEKLAGFSVAEMQEKLRQKETGSCTCDADDVLCKTMCGTLLGPDAEDVTVDTPRVRYAGKSEKGNFIAENTGSTEKPKKK